jgi:transcriptional regulator with XRE-family HTH domain
MTLPTPTESTREIVAHNVRRLRLGKDISQEQLAALAGFHRTYVSQVERCVTNISVDNIEKLAKVLEVEAWVLLKSSRPDHNIEQGS